jgi:hypothetical protein
MNDCTPHRVCEFDGKLDCYQKLPSRNIEI